MSDMAMNVLWSLGRTTLGLSIAALAATALLSVFRSRSPGVHRAAWLLTLVVGWTFLRVGVAVPWYAAQSPPASEALEAGQTDPQQVAVVTDHVDLSAAEPDGVEDLFADTSPVPEEFVLAKRAASAPPSGRVKSAAAAPARWNWLQWPVIAVGCWMLGMVGVAGSWFVGYLWFVRRLPAALAVEGTWADEWRRLLAARGVRREIALRVTHSAGPLLCRLPGGYALLVPRSLWESLDANSRGAILRHELAHYERGDVWTSLAARALALPHWFNPAAWWAVRRFDEAAEWACDLAATGVAPATDYAKALVRLGEGASQAAYARAFRGHTLASRVRRLLSGQPAEDSTRKKATLLVVGLCLAALPLVRVQLVAREPEAAADTSDYVIEEHRDDAGVVHQTERKRAAGGSSDPSYPIAPQAGAARADTSSGPTVSPYLNVLQKDDDATKAVEGEPQAAEGRLEIQATAAQRMVDEARRAFEASQAAYEAESVPLSEVYEWSLRWMKAASDISPDAKGTEAAVVAHLQRMRNTQKKIKLLFDVGAKGGEANQMAAANFYVAEAERRLAELRAQIKPSAPPPAALKMVDEARKAFEATWAAYESETITLDEVFDWSRRWKTAASDFTPDPAKKAAAAQAHWDRMKKVQEKIKTLHDAHQKGGEPNRMAAANFYLAEAERNLEEARAAVARPAASSLSVTFDADANDAEGVAETEPSRGTPSSAPQRIAAPGLRGWEKKKDLLYNDKDFRYWNVTLQRELSPERRTEAIRALAAFGANGQGREAAAAIVAAMRGYSVWMLDNSSEGALKMAALGAFERIPGQDALPVISDALQSPQDNQRLFAVYVLKMLDVPVGDAAKLFRQTLTDKNASVRISAAAGLAALEPDDSALLPVLREALNDPSIVDSALAIAGGARPVRGQRNANPRAIPALASEVAEQLAKGDGNTQRAAAQALVRMGPVAIPELEEILKTRNGYAKQLAQEAIERIRGNPALPGAQISDER